METSQTKQRAQENKPTTFVDQSVAHPVDTPPEHQPSTKTTLTKKSSTKCLNTPRRTEQAEATLKRAWEIADKGMFKEALLLWEHATRIQADITVPKETLLMWMINAQHYNKAIHFFTTNESELQYNHPQLWTTARELFALLCLLKDPETTPMPPWNKPPWNQSITMSNALTAYGRGEDLALQAYLAPIGPDSPFRPLRRILESLLLPPSEPDRINALLQNIPDSSPFAPLSAMARTRTLLPTELATALIELAPLERTPAALLCGVDEKYLKFLIKLAESKNPSQQMTLLLNHTELLPKDQARKLCLNLLPECMEARSRFEKLFGPLAEFERERVFALHHEGQKSFSRAITYWRKAVFLLESAPETETNRITMALIYHHLSQLEQQFATPSTTQIIHNAEQSIQLDPTNKAAWLTALQWRNRLKRDRPTLFQLANKAAKLFPEDTDILSMAMHRAIEKQSFKKAAGIAKKIRKLDPNHTDIMQICLTAQLHHARKRIQGGHYNLARKELQRAAPHASSNLLAQLNRLRAMLEFLDDQTETAIEILQAGRSNTTQKVLYTVEAFHEAVSLNLLPLILDRFRLDLIQCDGYPPNHEEVIAIANQVITSTLHHPECTTETMALLSGYFRKAAVLVYNHEEIRQICQALAVTQRYTLLTLYGKIAEVRWPQEPIFTYFRAFGECEAQAWRLTDQDFNTLFLAAEAIKETDPNGAEQINALLAIPAAQRPTDLWYSLPLSPAKIPKPLEAKLLKELRARLKEAFYANQDESITKRFKQRLIETLAPTEFGQRGLLVLDYLLDRALKNNPLSTKAHPRTQTVYKQLEMDLFCE